MLQRLLIALVQVKVANTSWNVLKEIGQTMFFVSSKRTTEKLYNNIINSVKI